jgi:large subunit ribosomal protein L15
MPKRGFNNAAFKRMVAIVNVGDLNGFDDGAEIGVDVLRAKGMIRGGFEALKILGNGELKKKLKIQAHQFSASARKKIEAAGGAASVLPPVERAAKADGKAAPAQ